MADVHTREIRSKNVTDIKSKNTKPEMLVRKFLPGRALNYLICFALFQIAIQSCHNRERIKKETKSTATDTVIRFLTINFYPSFTNPCMLHVDRVAKTVMLIVDTTKRFRYLRPGNLSLSLPDFEANTEIKKFYSPAYILSNRIDTTRSLMLDGISFLINYTEGDKEDSIYTGNNFPAQLGNNLLKQVLYLESRTNDKVMKKYLNNLAGYFR